MDLIGGGAAAGFVLTVVFACVVGVYAIVPALGAWVRVSWRVYFSPALIGVVWAPMMIHLGVSGVAVLLYRSESWQVEHTRALVMVACGTAIACTAWSHYRAQALVD